MTTRGKIQYDITANTARFTGAMQNVDRRLGGMTKTIQSMGGILAGAFAVGAIANFGKEVFKLAETAVEVRNAFARLNDPLLLQNLREATQGAVSDLELMKKAVSANNLGIPLKDMATLFEFATKRAAETGESVDNLVASIVTGIGRKSALVLDNLGIIMSTSGKSTREVSDAVVALAEDFLGDDGKGIGVNTTDTLNASFENLKLTLGDLILGEGSSFLTFLDDVVTGVDNIIKKIDQANLDNLIGQYFKAVKRGDFGEAEEIFNKVGAGALFPFAQGGKGPKRAAARSGGLDFKQPQLQGFKFIAEDREITRNIEAEITQEMLNQEALWTAQAERAKEINDLMGEIAEEDIEPITESFETIEQATEQWNAGLHGVSGILNGINAGLLLAGERTSGLSKALLILTSVSSLIQSIGGGFGVLQGILGGGGGGSSLKTFKLVGQDLFASVNDTGKINTSLGALYGPVRN